jgi:hypothetical protein
MESDLSQSHRTLRAEKDEKFLGNKRDIRVLRENLLFRRLHTGKFSGRYENLSNIFFNMMAFDWDEEKISKLRSNVGNNCII